MQKSTALKSILIVVAAALAGIAVADIDFLNQYDELLLLVAGLMGGGAGIKRPGDVKVEKAKEPPPPPVGPVALLLLALGALSQHACRPSQDPCNETNLAVLVAQCRARVELECREVADDDCPAIKECDAAVDSRCGGSK